MQSSPSSLSPSRKYLAPPTLSKGDRTWLRNSIHINHNSQYRRGMPPPRFSIDRRAYLVNSYQRQMQKEQALEQLIKEISEGQASEPIEMQDIASLEALVEAIGPSRIVVLFFYSKTCGVCKKAAAVYESMAKEAKGSRARAVFLKHNIYDEYDHRSDLSKMHKIRSVPCFLFLDDGAVIERLSLRDIRAMGDYSSPMIQEALSEDVKRLQTTYRKFMIRRAPGARA